MPPAHPFAPPNLRGGAVLLLALFVAGCASSPEPVARKEPEPLLCPPAPIPACPTLPKPVCPPVEKPVCPPEPPAPAAPAAAAQVEYRGRLQIASWADLPDWKREPLREALVAFTRGCSVLAKQVAWQSVCNDAASLGPGAPESGVALFFESRFDPYQVINADESTSGMVTGYYEPLLRGSRVRTPKYRYPIYAVPQDLLVVDLAEVYPDLKYRRLRGRINGGRVVPYFSRGEIETEAPPLKGLEIAWVDDAVELFFLHIQGSGQVQLENGERLRVGYAEQNGHPFHSLGRLLIRRGELPPERASMQGIKDWAKRHPGKVQRYLNENPSFVFFRELPQDLPGPIGTLGVALTPERSIAVDPRVIPLGVPVYLATTMPNASQSLNRLMVAQDTGGAINGGVRADFFWGFGDEAGNQAGKMRQAGRMWVLLPKGYAPPTTVKPVPTS